MKFLTVAKVLILNQLKSYRVHKFILVFDAIMITFLFIFVVLALMVLNTPFASEFVRLLYSKITAYVSVGEIVIKLSAVLSALIYLPALFGRDIYRVTSEHYPILLHPVSFRDFLLGKTIADTFIFAKFNIAMIWIFYALTAIAGNAFSALLAFLVYVIGAIYLELLHTAIKLLKRFEWFKALCLVLAVLSVLDFAKGYVTVSLPVYIWIHAIVSCYTNFNGIAPFILALMILIAVLSVLSERLTPEIEPILVLRDEKTVKSVNISKTITKTFVELKRMRLWITPFFAILAYPVGLMLKSLIPKTLTGALPFYIMFMLLGIVDHVVLQEASLIWFYRMCNAVKEFAKNVIFKAVAVYLCLLIPCLAFVLAIKPDLIVVAELIFLILLISAIQSVGATLTASKSRFKVTRLLGTYSTQSVAVHFQLLYMMAEMCIIAVILVIVTMFKFALVILAIASIVSLFVGLKVVEKVATNVEVR